MISSRALKFFIASFGLLVLATTGLVFAHPVFAQDTALEEVGAASGLGDTDVRIIIAQVINAALGLLGIIAVSLIIYSGFLWMTAAGHPDRVKKAKAVMINAIVGLVIILASYAITAYVLDKLTEATGYEGSSSTSSSGTSSLGSTSSSVFSVSGVSPQGTQTIQNLAVRLTFNKDVDETTVADNILITTSGISVDGTYETDGKKVTFTPSTLCEGYTDVYCFAADEAFTIQIDEGLQSTTGLSLTCGGLYDECTYTFTSGSAIDTQDPTISMTYPDDGDSLEENTTITLQADVTDDAGVSLVEFYVDDLLVGEDQPSGSTPTTYSAEYDLDLSAYTTGERYDFTALAYDVDSNDETSDAVRATIRAAHCFNGSTDEDEEGEDCGGADCAACGGAECTENSDCASGVCEEGVCVDYPEISGISPTDGAEGTYVTISGTNFGSQKGTVSIGETEAALASCSDPWDTDQIIAVVPDDLLFDAAHSVTVTTADGYSDTNDDNNGPLVDPFTVNATVRPGICEVSPESDLVGEIIALLGVNFEATQGSYSYVYFATTEAGAYNDWADDELRVTVPTLAVDDYDLSVEVNGTSSNTVTFSVLDEDASDTPTIGSIDPESGPEGEYITISGENFGSSVGAVYFVNRDSDSASLDVETIADVDFPAICEDNYWQRDQIVVKVPTGLDTSATDFELYVQRADSEVSDAVDFTLQSGTAGPGVCSVDPTSGPAGSTDVTIGGERFGEMSSGEDGTVTFYQSVDGATTTASIASGDVTSWEDEEILLTVPADAVTGPMIVYDANGDASNATNFEVGDCNDDASLCDSNTEQCCASGSCVSTGSTCPEAAAAIAAHYAWYFSTGSIPVVPEVVEECSGSVISPTPWDGRAGDNGETVCVNAAISATFDIAMDETTFTDSTIQLAKCTGTTGDTTDVCDATSSVSWSSITTTSKSFTATPAATLDTSSTYQVTLTSGIESYNGVALETTTWTFGTSDSSQVCDINSVLVTPAEEEISTQYGTANFNAQAVADDACVILDSSSYSWTWATDGTYADLATATSDCTGSPSSCQVIEGLQETPSNSPTYVLAEEATEGLDDTADLTVNFTDPYVIDQWPDCSEACVNASVIAEFNTAMDATSALAASAFTLYSCSDEQCDGLTIATDVPGSLTQSSDLTTLTFTPHSYLSPNTYYRVVLAGSIASTSGVTLRASEAATLNYQSGQDYSWVFKTRDDTAACTIDRVELEPPSALVDAIGQMTVFEASAFGPPDDCSVSGQPLTATDYDWTWTIADSLIATLFDGGDIEVAQDKIPDGCTTTCVAEGTIAYAAICGEDADGDGDRVDTGEDCDDGNATSGDGCSAECQHEGTSACASATDTNCCGNGTLDSGEECDDGAAGCSSVCLNEGSEEVGATCGDAIVTPDTSLNPLAGGEECDDGNTTDGDGCSGVCLNEGSFAVSALTGVCGNGLVESPAEECDDDNATDGDGCSATCLSEGTAACADPSVDVKCCGNNSTESTSRGLGETCDDGNTTDGDGCSARCLLEGSGVDYATPSFCADATVGTGESSACEVSASDLDGLAEPVQISIIADTAPAEVDETDHEAVTTITAAANSESVDGQIVLECSATEDADCADETNYGAGTNGCCYARPTVSAYTPTTSGACRNAAISFTFDQQMNLSTFEDSVSVTLNLAADETCPYESSSARATGFFGRLWQGVVRVFGWLIPGAGAQSTTCTMPVTFMTQSTSAGERVYLLYEELLEANASYTVSLTGDPSHTGAGARSANGVGLASDYSFTVDTGSEYCALESVQITDSDETSPNYFAETNEAHTLTAAGYTTVDGVVQELQAIAGFYDWSFGSWTVSDESIFSVDSSTDPQGDSATVTALGQNGDAEISVTATITRDEVFNPTTLGETVVGTENLTAFLCENPWPEVVAFPFEDSADATSADPDGDGVDEILELTGFMHFSTYYCRDAGDEGTSDDYSAANAVAVSDPPGDVLKEYLFELDDDVIGVRIVPNEDLFSLRRWYSEQGFTGSPSETTVDGYDALTDGRTTYVGVANEADSGKVYANIFAISYNANADEETVAMYEQMLSNLSFNTNLSNTGFCYDEDTDGDPGNDTVSTDSNGDTVSCTADRDCDSENCHADKDKLARDLTRLTDLRDLEIALESYGEENGRCSATTSVSCTTDDDCPDGESCEALYPELESGTYLRSYAVSPWESWEQVLDTALEAADIPVDPLNAFVACGESGSVWENFDGTTCFDESTTKFVCPKGSQVYLYRNIGGTGYQLQTDLEYAYTSGTTEWAYDLDADTTDLLRLRAGSAFSSSSVGGYQSSPVCNNRVYGVSSECGDGTLGSSETCEVGDTGETTCTAVVCVSSDADYDGQACVVDCDTASSICGGDADGDGLCDSGSAVGLSCDTGEVDCTDTTICQSVTTSVGVQQTECKTNCSGYTASLEAACVPVRCGNGVVEGTEECDDGSHNGDYGYCGTSCTYDSGYYCGDGTLAGGETCDLGELNGVYAKNAANTCSSTCDGPGPSCGDTDVNGSEECDGEGEEWEGALCDDGTPCASDGDCTDGSTCGQTYEACPVAHICVGGTYDGWICEVPDVAYSGEATLNTYCTNGGGECDTSAFTYQTYRTRSCDDEGATATCDWNSWTACTVADQLCGNGEVEGEEECDDGDDDNNDSCTSACTENVCGDGYLYTGSETCDEGADNGVICDADFGETCRYCSVSCNYLTASGDYCGDGDLDLGDEFCDASQFGSFSCLSGRTIGSSCSTVGSTTECEDDGSSYTCRQVGICNGGSYGGSYCFKDDQCGTGYECELPVCASNCGSTCPLTYETSAVSITSEEAGASPAESLDLYSSGSSDTPNAATLTIPACRVASALRADITAADRTYPDTAIVFVLDKSQSMDNTFDSGETRLEVLTDAVSSSIDELFDAYTDLGGATLQIGFVAYGGVHGTDSDGDFALSGDEISVNTEQPLVTEEDEETLLSNLQSAMSAVATPEGTPIYAGMYRAAQLLQDSGAEKKVMIIFTDGNIQLNDDDWYFTSIWNANLTGGGVVDYENYLQGVENLKLMYDSFGVEFFTAALSDSSCEQQQMQNFSSMECEEDPSGTCTDNYVEGNVTCSVGDNGITYAFAGESASDLEEMYVQIVDALVNVQVRLTDEDGNTDSATVEMGERITLPLPTGFLCDGVNEQEMAMTVYFSGEGAMEFSNIELDFCEP